MNADEIWRRIQDAEPDIAERMKADATRLPVLGWYRRYWVTFDELSGPTDPFVTQIFAEQIHGRLSLCIQGERDLLH
jgi:hypothetical protein